MQFIDKTICFQNKINLANTPRTAEYVNLPNVRTTWDSNKDLTTTQTSYKLILPPKCTCTSSHLEWILWDNQENVKYKTSPYNASCMVGYIYIYHLYACRQNALLSFSDSSWNTVANGIASVPFFRYLYYSLLW